MAFAAMSRGYPIAASILIGASLGVLAAGAVLNPLLPNYRAHELRHVLAVSHAKAAAGEAARALIERVGGLCLVACPSAPALPPPICPAAFP